MPPPYLQLSSGVTLLCRLNKPGMFPDSSNTETKGDKMLVRYWDYSSNLHRANVFSCFLFCCFTFFSLSNHMLFKISTQWDWRKYFQDSTEKDHSFVREVNFSKWKMTSCPTRDWTPSPILVSVAPNSKLPTWTRP